MGGYYADDGNYKPTLWVNGERQSLSMLDTDLIGYAYAIQIYKGSVYISGHTTRMNDPDVTPQVLDTIACYWVDGQRVDLPGLVEQGVSGVDGNGLAIYVSEK